MNLKSITIFSLKVKNHHNFSKHWDYNISEEIIVPLLSSVLDRLGNDSTFDFSMFSPFFFSWTLHFFFIFTSTPFFVSWPCFLLSPGLNHSFRFFLLFSFHLLSFIPLIFLFKVSSSHFLFYHKLLASSSSRSYRTWIILLVFFFSS
jgi:hypothetical protein